MTTKAKSKQPERLKRLRGALLRAIVAGHISTEEANKRYLGGDVLAGPVKAEAEAFLAKLKRRKR